MGLRSFLKSKVDKHGSVGAAAKAAIQRPMVLFNGGAGMRSSAPAADLGLDRLQAAFTNLPTAPDAAPELYDVTSDPAEQRDLAAAQPERVAALRASILADADRRSGATRPRNVLVFLTDDQRFDQMSCAGHPVLRTPNIDGLAARGEGGRRGRHRRRTPTNTTPPAVWAHPAAESGAHNE